MKKSSIVLLTIVLTIVVFMLVAISIGNNREEQSKINETSVIQNKTIGSTKQLPAKIPHPLPVVIIPTPTPQPTMAEKPKITLEGPSNVKKGEEFTLALKISSAGSDKIIGIGTDVSFDKKNLKVVGVELINADKNSSTGGTIWSNAVTGVNALNNNGINGNYAVIRFAAKETGEVKITAKATAVDENMISADILSVKIIKIV